MVSDSRINIRFMKKIVSFLHNFLNAHPGVRSCIRWLRWQTKKVPLLRNISMLIDRQYFASSGEERPDEHNGVVGDPYFESYAAVLSKKCRGRVLDLGCGHGFLTARLAESPAVNAIVGLDKINDFRAPHPKVSYQTQDLSTTAALPKGFDTVVTSEFIEHISEEAFERLLVRVAVALLPGGIFIGSTPKNPTPYSVFSGSQFHVREYNTKDLKRILEKQFEQVSVVPISEYCLTWEAHKR